MILSSNLSSMLHLLYPIHEIFIYLSIDIELLNHILEILDSIEMQVIFEVHNHFFNAYGIKIRD